MHQQEKLGYKSFYDTRQEKKGQKNSIFENLKKM
jgi:hypothetical protein